MGNYIGRVEFLNRKDKNHRIKAEFYKDDQIFTGKIYSQTVFPVQLRLGFLTLPLEHCISIKILDRKKISYQHQNSMCFIRQTID